MAGKRRLTKAYKNLDIQKADEIVQIPGILGFPIGGRPIVQVANRPGYVYVRFRDNLSEVVQAYNDTVSPVYNLPVLVMRDKNDRSRYRIQGRDLGRYENWSTSTAYLPLHGSNHSFDPDYPGGDIVWVFPGQFTPLQVLPSGTSAAGNLLIKKYVYYRDSGWRCIGGTGTASALDYKPSGSSQSRVVLLYLDQNDNPQFTAGELFTPSGTYIQDIAYKIPATPSSSCIPLAGILLSSGSSVVNWDNLYDLRQFIHSSVSSSPGGGVGGAIGIYNNGSFMVSGTALDFGSGLLVSVTGTTAYVSVGGVGSGLLGSKVTTGTSSYSLNGTWETITGTTVIFSTSTVASHLVIATVEVRGTSANWDRYAHRLLLNSGTSGYSPNQYVEGKDSNADTSNWRDITLQFVLTNLPIGTHRIDLQTSDDSSNLDRQYRVTAISVI